MNNIRKYKKALVLGCGRSGRAAAELLISEGSRVTVLTEEPPAENPGRMPVEVLNRQDELPLSGVQICIVSPGFGINHPWIRKIKARGIPLLSELELGWSRCRGRVVAVTGSNGKSTAVKFICDALTAAGKSAVAAGNYGLPVSAAVMEFADRDWFVLEVSSFQLETVRSFRADLGVLLNIQPDHLDRHGGMEKYLQTKMRLFANRGAEDFCLIPPDLWASAERIVGMEIGRWFTFGGPGADYSFRSGRISFGAGREADFSASILGNELWGPVVLAAACGVLEHCGLSIGQIVEAAKRFEPLAHRLERVAELNGVLFVNDSKATNLNALSAAVRSQARPVRLIAGGRAKESDFERVIDTLASGVSKIYLVGESANAMLFAWASRIPCLNCDSLEAVFDMVRKEACPGEVVLLSPGCASFDQFNSFEERGDRFKTLVAESGWAGFD